MPGLLLLFVAKYHILKKHFSLSWRDISQTTRAKNLNPLKGETKPLSENLRILSASALTRHQTRSP